MLDRKDIEFLKADGLIVRGWSFVPRGTLDPKKLVTIQGDCFDPYLGQFEKSSAAAIGLVRGSPEIGDWARQCATPLRVGRSG
jgi:hypothetical protein